MFQLTNYIFRQLEELNGGVGNKPLKTLKDAPEDPVDKQRRQKVKEAMIHAWSSYEKYAWGKDELQVYNYFPKYISPL